MKTETAANGQLAKAQVRILKALANGGMLNSATLAEKASVPLTHITGFTLRQYASKRTPALVEQKLVRAIEHDPVGDGKKERHYEITAAGRKIAAKL